METKRLYRSNRDKQFGGVCGGLAEYFNIDPTLVRILFAVGTLMGGPGLLLYIILWLVIPEAPADDGLYEKPKNDDL